MAASVQIVDFRLVDDDRHPLPLRPQHHITGRAKSTSRKQMRARARRAATKGKVTTELDLLYKPIEEWDAEELARGRPRDKGGLFRGRAPTWITREVHEQAVERFRQVVRDGMNAATVDALKIIGGILVDESTDDDGRPRVAASTKLDAAKFLVEHVLGKPKQRTETDISVRLQGMLASAVITPGMLPAQIGAGAQASPRTPEEFGLFEDAEWSDEEDG